MQVAKSGNRPRFTVVIPTRERPDTLRSALQTCLVQDYPDWEIIVSDNFSDDDTQQVVEAAHDDRVRYVNTGQRLSMTHNWEFALSHMRGQYVTYVGDDDGLLPGALSTLERMIQRTGAEAIAWDKAQYYWPDYIDPAWRNILVIPLHKSIKRVASATVLRDIAEFRSPYTVLPTLYNAVVSREAIARVQARTGNFFHSMIPDIYSGVALAATMDGFYFSRRPFSLAGSSRHSGGMSRLYPDKEAGPGEKFASEGNILFHHRVVDCPSIHVIMAETFFQAADQGLGGALLDVDIGQLLAVAAQEAVHRSPAQYERIRQALVETGKRNGLEAEARRLTEQYRNRPWREVAPVSGLNLVKGHVVLNGAPLGVRDVAGAASFCQHYLSLVAAGYLSPLGIAKTTGSLAWRELRKRVG
jgi:glycosyltransferase involved in cell wall biosynthesis